jgi:hypothetical protein
VHFFNFILSTNLLVRSKTWHKSSNQCGLDYYVIDVDLHQLADQIMIDVFHGALVRGTAFFNPMVMTMYSNNPTAPGTRNAVLCMSSGAMKI